MDTQSQLESLEERIGYRFHDRTLLERALTHSSFANEVVSQTRADYERLEFLGDAALELISSAYLYARYPEMREGELTKRRAALVCESALYEKAERFDLKAFIRLGKGEEKSGGRGRASIISDVTEALIGAIYLDGGIDEATLFVRQFILTDDGETADDTDFKSALQEMAQAKGATTPRYEVVREEGPAHDKRFVCAVYLNKEKLGEGEGRSKKAAQQEAAREAIRQIEKGEICI